MPNYMSANWDPVANAVKTFGNNYANTALKKLELDRQLGKDIYDAARTEAATNYDIARTADQKLKTDNLRRLTELFKPEVFTPLQQSSLGAGAMVGDTSLNSILRGSDAAMLSGMKEELYKTGDPTTKLQIALDKFTPGGSVNGGGEKPISPADIGRAFSYYVKEKDQYGNEVTRLRRDLMGEKQFFDWCKKTGATPTRSLLYEYLANKDRPEIMPPSNAPAAPAVPASTNEDGLVESVMKMVGGWLGGDKQAPDQTPQTSVPNTPAVNSPQPAQTPAPVSNAYPELQGLPISSQQECMAFIDAFKNGEISKEQLRKFLMGYGVK